MGVQNDFCKGGSLAVKDGNAVIPLINDLRARKSFDLTVFTQDWHPPNHISYASNHQNMKPFESINLTYTTGQRVCGTQYLSKYGTNATTDCSPVVEVFDQTVWPDHCVHESPVAQIHSDLDRSVHFNTPVHFVKKGLEEQVDSYSAIYNIVGTSETLVPALLRDAGIEVVYVAGLALDYC